jgi:hypothetical protein
VEFKLGHSSQLRILHMGQVQVHPTSSHFDGMSDRVLALGIGEASAPLDQLNDLVLRREVQRPRQRSLKVIFQELAISAVGPHETHVDPVSVGLFRHAAIVGDQDAKVVHRGKRRRGTGPQIYACRTKGEERKMRHADKKRTKASRAEKRAGADMGRILGHCYFPSPRHSASSSDCYRGRPSCPLLCILANGWQRIQVSLAHCWGCIFDACSRLHNCNVWLLDMAKNNRQSRTCFLSGLRW